MEPTTLAAIGIGLYFLLAGGDKKNGKKDDPTPDQDDCPEGYTRNAQGQCVAKGTTVNCAPGLVRGPDGKCRKKIKAKPGDDVDPNDISDVKPDVIADDDAWIAPGCKSLFYGPDFFRGTIMPTVVAQTNAGFGWGQLEASALPDVEMNVFDAARNNVESARIYGPHYLAKVFLDTYRPGCLDEWYASATARFPTVDEIQGPAEKCQQVQDSFDQYPDQETYEAAFQEACSPTNVGLVKGWYVASINDLKNYVQGDVLNLAAAIMKSSRELAASREAETRGFTYQLPGEKWNEFPASLRPKAEDFA